MLRHSVLLLSLLFFFSIHFRQTRYHILWVAFGRFCSAALLYIWYIRWQCTLYVVSQCLAVSPIRFRSAFDMFAKRKSKKIRTPPPNFTLRRKWHRECHQKNICIESEFECGDAEAETHLGGIYDINRTRTSLLWSSLPNPRRTRHNSKKRYLGTYSLLNYFFSTLSLVTRVRVGSSFFKNCRPYSSVRVPSLAVALKK